MKFDCHQSIKKILDFNQVPTEQNAQLNIAWGVDKNFMFGAAISMTSVLLHNKGLNIHFHLLPIIWMKTISKNCKVSRAIFCEYLDLCHGF